MTGSTLVCRVELSKTDGVTITVTNATDGITQTLVLDGKTITTTCKGKEETSTIVQAPESITMRSASMPGLKLPALSSTPSSSAARLVAPWSA